MNVLVVNCGSSSFKFRVLNADGFQVGPPAARGVVEGIGDRPALRFAAGDHEAVDDHPEIHDHADAARRALAWLREVGVLQTLEAVGHRVVHGGARFTKPALVDNDVISGIESAAKLAPLHNRPSLQAIDAVRQSLPAVPNVAVFDTSFFAALPEAASRYPIPLDLAERHGIRRFGFHGIAHRSARGWKIGSRGCSDIALPFSGVAALARPLSVFLFGGRLALGSVSPMSSRLRA